MSLISRHFAIDEFRCHDGTRYPADWEDSRLQTLCNVLDAIRDAYGGPIIIVCGYRSIGYNKALRAESLRRNGGVSGVAINSQHTLGTAADITTEKRSMYTVGTLHDLIKQMYADGKIQDLGGLGYYPSSWCHVDIRPKVNGAITQWNGNGFGNGSDQ